MYTNNLKIKDKLKTKKISSCKLKKVFFSPKSISFVAALKWNGRT